MNYKQTKIKAQMSADASGLDYAILHNGIEYDYVIAKRFKGEVFEMVYPQKEINSTDKNIEQIYNSDEQTEAKPKKRNVSKG